MASNDRFKFPRWKGAGNRTLNPPIMTSQLTYHSLIPEGMFLVSPSNDTTMSPPGSPTLWAAGNEPKKLTSPMVVRNPCSIPRLCQVTSATWCDTKPRVKATSFSVSYKFKSLACKDIFFYVALIDVQIDLVAHCHLESLESLHIFAVAWSLSSPPPPHHNTMLIFCYSA